MSFKREPFKDFLWSLWIIIASVPFTVFFPVCLLLIALPIKLYSKFIAYLSYLTDPHKGAIVTGIGAAQIRDIDIMYKKPRNCEVACMKLKGELNYDRILNAFHERVVLKLDEAKPYPKLHYPELRQYFTKFLGYVFLKTDHNFDMKNHISLYNEQPRTAPVTRKELMKIWEELMIKPFAKNKSAWEFVIIENYTPDEDELNTWNDTGNLMNGDSSKDKYWVAFLRVHHGLADGFSVQKMLGYLADGVYAPKFPAKMTRFQNILLNLRTAFLGPYDLMNQWVHSRESYHCLHLPPSKQSGEYFVVESNLISTNRIKFIKSKFKVSFTTILVAAISGGMRRYFKKYDIPIPTYMSAAIPFATSEHSDKLTNEFLLAPVEYAVNCDDARERVEYVEEKMKLLVRTSFIRVFNFIADITCTVPQPILKWLTEKQMFSSTYSTQPGPPKGLTTFGTTLLEVNYTYGCGVDSPSFGISTLTYNGHFRMVLFIDKNAVESRIAAEDIVQFISDEFDVLEHHPHDPDFVKEKQRKQSWIESVELD